MPAKEKLEYIGALNEILQSKSQFILASYQGLNVSQMESLRTVLGAHDVRLKVIKNRLFQRAISESSLHASSSVEVKQHLQGQLMVAFVDKNFSAVGKKIIDFGKETKKVDIKSGFFDGKLLDATQIIEIAQLPSREELLVVIARGLNAPATRIALGAKEVIRKLAFGISLLAKAKNKD